VTDANLVLGRLDPDGFAGGQIPLSPDLSAATIEAALASTAGLEMAEAAFGVTEMVDENMANAARVHTVEHGRDVERFTMIAFGGGAPLHACRLCEKLGIDRLIVPPGAGVGSAIGFLRAPFSYEATRGFYQRLDSFDPKAANRLIDELRAEAEAFVASGSTGATETRLTIFMRYTGQGWEIPVQYAADTFTGEDAPALQSAFEAAYRVLFGRTIDGLAVEITNWALNVATPVPPVPRVTPPSKRKPVRSTWTREIFDAGRRETLTASELPRSGMAPGDSIDGPAVITEDETTTIVTAAFRATMQPDGALLIERKEPRP